jgi:hypothetical protein
VADCLPNADAAIVDVTKLEAYVLNDEHPRGRHKARVFLASLGIRRTDAAWLRPALLDGVQSHPALRLEADQWGERWQVDVSLRQKHRRAIVRTVWIIRSSEDIPRLVTCWIL